MMSNNKLNSATVSNNTINYSPSDIKLRKLASFCTITTMICQIQQLEPFKERQLGQSSTDPHHKLMLSNAFCTLAATEHDVVAIATKMDPDALHVTVCTNILNNKGHTLTLPQPVTSSSSFINRVRNFIQVSPSSFID
jgi:hypothetical protein